MFSGSFNIKTSNPLSSRISLGNEERYNNLKSNMLYFGYYDSFLRTLTDTEKYDNLQKSPGNMPCFYYDFDETHFFAFTKEEQKKAIYDFIKECIDFTKL